MVHNKSFENLNDINRKMNSKKNPYNGKSYKQMQQNNLSVLAPVQHLSSFLDKMIHRDRPSLQCSASCRPLRILTTQKQPNRQIKNYQHNNDVVMLKTTFAVTFSPSTIIGSRLQDKLHAICE